MWMLLLVGCGALAPVALETPSRWSEVEALASLDSCGPDEVGFASRDAVAAWHAANPTGWSRIASMDLYGRYDTDSKLVSASELPAAAHAAQSTARCGGLMATMVSVRVAQRLCEQHDDAWVAALGGELQPASNQAVAAREALSLYAMMTRYEEDGQMLSNAQINGAAADLQAWVLDTPHEAGLAIPTASDGPHQAISGTLFRGIAGVAGDFSKELRALEACRDRAATP